jgi:hypothetical protein
MKKYLILLFISLFLSGLFDGLNQTYLHHYWKFKEVFTDSKPNSIAWKNKYKQVGGELVFPLEEKFFGSTTFLAWSQDWNHLSRTLSRFFVFLGIMFAMKIKFRWWYFLLIYTVWICGFHLIYTIIF